MSDNPLIEAYEKKAAASYKSGQADVCDRLLILFDEELNGNVITWLRQERDDCRAEGIRILDQAIKQLENQ